MEILVMKTNINPIDLDSTIMPKGLMPIGLIRGGLLHSGLMHKGVVSLSLLGLMLAAGPVTAASVCKGLDNSACNDNAACGWVEGYERKDGRTVRSFCRTKSVSKKKPTQQPTAKHVDSANPIARK